MMTLIEMYLSCKTRGLELEKMKGVEFLRGTPPISRVRGGLHVNIDESTTYQEIIGIGYSFEHTSCKNMMALDAGDRTHLLELLVDPVKGAGLNLWRLCIGTPDFTYKFYTYDDQPPGHEDPTLEHFSIEADRECIIPVVKEALTINPDLLFFASPWSPPAWMKEPPVKHRGYRKTPKGASLVEKRQKYFMKNNLPLENIGICGGRLLPEYYDVYAEYLVRFLQAYHDEGIPIHAITVQNEPLHDVVSMPSCNWSGEEERDFIKNHLGPTLTESGLETKIWCYDHNWGFLSPAKYPQVILDDSDAKKHVDGVAFHHYDMGRPKHVDFMRAKYPGTRFYFTEGTVFMLMGARRITRYFKHHHSSYNGWVPFIATDGTPNMGPFKITNTFLQRRVEDNSIQINFDYYIQSHFAKFIKRGARRIASTTKTPPLISEVSFKNPDGTIVSILSNGRRFRSLPASITWNDHTASFTLPSRSICTLRWKGDTKP